MKVHYIVDIQNPQHHHVKVTLKVTKPKGADKVSFFLPVWSPGSYLVREYARHIRWFEASQSNGEILFHTQKEKSLWEVEWSKSGLKQDLDDFQRAIIGISHS